MICTSHGAVLSKRHLNGVDCAEVWRRWIRNDEESVLEGFFSSVRTAHFILLAIAASILLFALSPRDAEEYASALLEAEFLNEAFPQPHGSSIFVRYAPDQTETDRASKYVGSLFSDQGIVLANYFRYWGPISEVTLPSRPTFQDIARVSRIHEPAVVYALDESEVLRIVKSFRSNETAECFKPDQDVGLKMLIFESGLIERCAPLDPKWVLHEILVAVYDDATKAVDIQTVPAHGPLYPKGESSSWYAFMLFANNTERAIYAAPVLPRKEFALGGLETSPHEVFRIATRDSTLLAKARGDTTLLGRLSLPLREAWCDIQLRKRDEQIRVVYEANAYDTMPIEDETLLAAHQHNQIDLILRHAYGECHPGNNILGLPHLDATWWEIAEITPKEATALFQQKANSSRQRISVGGFEIDERSVRIFLPFGCLAVSLFLLSNLVILRQLVSERKRRNSLGDELDYPWIGLFSDPLSRTLTWLSVGAIPVLVPPVVLFQLSEQFDSACVLGVIFTISTMVVAFRSLRIIRQLRLARVRVSSTA